MLADTRHSRILARIDEKGEASVRDLSELLAVSPATIRRDLTVLGDAGRLQRVRGGARAGIGLQEPDERPFHVVAESAHASKDRIARRAAELVADGDIVLLDIGTTTALIARALRGRPVTIVTASVAVLDELRDDSEVELVLLGGTLRRSYHSLVGPITQLALQQMRATIAFVGTSGIADDGTVLDTTVVEVPVKRAIVRSASRVVLVADENKFPGTGLLSACSPEDFHTLVTSENSDPDTLATLTKLGIEVIQV
ncbi:Glycerol-3-phosphate regulon repressor [Leucobacter aridicollis]|uniref:DeoR/GlpR family DNA-binding transcription regulator n=1 Tax=Leucobacter aridicollis TaxID=283878 RepID=UPI0037C5FC50